MTFSNQPETGESRTGVHPEHPHTNSAPFGNDSLAVLGHEIRNPLSALSYALQAWPASQDDPQVTEQLLRIIRREVSQMTRLYNDCPLARSQRTPHVGCES